MAGIGDYVHYHMSNYQNYGIGQSGNFSFRDQWPGILASAHRQLNALYRSKINYNVNWKPYADMLTDMFYFKANTLYSDDISVQEVQEIQSEILDYLFNTYGRNDLHPADLIRVAMWEDPSGIAFKAYRGSSRKNKLGQTIYNTEVTKRSIEKTLSVIGPLKDYIMKQAAAGKLDYQKAKEYDKAIDEARTKISAALKKHRVTNKKGQKTNKFSFREKATSKNSYSELGQLLLQFNNLVNEIRNAEIRKMTGDAAEYSAAAFTYVVGNFGAKVTKNLLQTSLVQGHQTQQTKLSGFSSYIDTSLLEEELNKITEKNHGVRTWSNQNGVLVNAHATQGTLDISVPLDPESKLAQEMGINHIKGSVKSYSNINRGIGVIRGVPLTSIFMLLDHTFINHYLNIMSAHGVKGFSSLKNAKKDATDIIKKAVAIRALTGIRSKLDTNQNVVDCLIVNNKQEEKVYVISTGQLLDYIGSNFDAYTTFKSIPEKELAKFNAWAGAKTPDATAAVQRITNLIFGVHQQKISMSLKGRTVKEVAKKYSV